MFAKRWAQLIIVATFLLVVLGGLVHTRGASLACPDWPLCFGMVFPPMEGGVLLEHSHRLLASGVGIGVIVLLVAAWPQAPLRGLLVGGLALVLGQGALGGLTVIYRLPPPISIAHLGTSMLFFAWAVRVSQRLDESLRAGDPARAADLPAVAHLRRQLGWALGLVYAQLIVGAAVRHTHASLSCGTEAILCQGALLPTTGPQILQTVHRVLALVAVGGVVAWTLPALRWAKANNEGRLRRLIVASHAIVTLQVVMGVLTIKTAIHTHVVVTHLALAALLWGALVAARGRLTAQTHPVGAVAATAAEGPTAPHSTPSFG